MVPLHISPAWYIAGNKIFTEAQTKRCCLSNTGTIFTVHIHTDIFLIRGGVEDTGLEAKAKDTKKIRGQRQPFRGQTLSRPRTGMLEAKAKDQGHKAQVLSKKKKKKKKKKGPHKNFSSDLH